MTCTGTRLGFAWLFSFGCTIRATWHVPPLLVSEVRRNITSGTLKIVLCSSYRYVVANVPSGVENKTCVSVTACLMWWSRVAGDGGHSRDFISVDECASKNLQLWKETTLQNVIFFCPILCRSGEIWELRTHFALLTSVQLEGWRSPRAEIQERWGKGSMKRTKFVIGGFLWLKSRVQKEVGVLVDLAARPSETRNCLPFEWGLEWVGDVFSLTTLLFARVI